MDFFADEEVAVAEPAGAPASTWKVVVIDDEPHIHAITRMVLTGFSYQGRPVELISAYSATEGEAVLAANPDAAVVLLDVVMETTDAGLRLVPIIREDLGLASPRIVLRTGQPGDEPEHSLLQRYDLNGYENKADLTAPKLLALLTVALRAHENVVALKRYSEHLEDMLAERTAQLEDKTVALEESLHTVRQSITYARRIQHSMLPDPARLRRHLPQSFVHYAPKDIVSGDFWWTHEQDNHLLLAVADCTGHGVPGAFMSMLGVTIMTQLVREVGFGASLGTLLQELNARLNLLLNQGFQPTPGAVPPLDGMDIVLIRLDLATGRLEFASANRPLYVASGGELQVLRGTPRPIGGATLLAEGGAVSYEEQAIQLTEGDMVYLLTDGLADQFGGPDRKLGGKRLRPLLLELSAAPTDEQARRLAATLMDWRGELPQTDDQLLVGFRWQRAA